MFQTVKKWSDLSTEEALRISMGLERVLLLGDKRLYNKSDIVKCNELDNLQNHISNMHNIILEYREKYGAGRAIAAPQIGLFKRIICFNVGKPITMINPQLSDFSSDTIELWDDCMSFPSLLVKVKRFKSCSLTFRDLDWNKHIWELTDDLSELFQHEYDHLDGVLATQRAIDCKSFKIKGDL